MVVVTPPDHPLAKERELTIEKLAGLDFVAFDRDLPIRREVDKAFRQNGVRVNVVTEFDNIETIKQAIQVGIGSSILPLPTVVADVERGLLAAGGEVGCVPEGEHPEGGDPLPAFFRHQSGDGGGEGTGPVPEGHGGNAQEVPQHHALHPEMAEEQDAVPVGLL